MFAWQRRSNRAPSESPHALANVARAHTHKGHPRSSGALTWNFSLFLRTLKMTTHTAPMISDVMSGESGLGITVDGQITLEPRTRGP